MAPARNAVAVSGSRDSPSARSSRLFAAIRLVHNAADTSSAANSPPPPAWRRANNSAIAANCTDEANDANRSAATIASISVASSAAAMSSPANTVAEPGTSPVSNIRST